MKSFAFHGHTKPVTSIQFSDEGDLLFSASKDGSCAVWNVATGARLGTYAGHKSIMGLNVNHATSLLCTAGSDFMVKLWRVQDGECLGTIDPGVPTRSPGFSHDDSMLMVVTDAKMGKKAGLHLFNVPRDLGYAPVKSEWKPFTSFTQPEGICHATWGPTNDTIYFCSEDGSVSIYDVEKQQEIRNVIPHNEEVRRIRFDPKYYTLITASKDKSAKLLDSRALKTIATYTSDMPINDAQISPIADQIMLGGGTEAVDVTTTAGGSQFPVRFYHKVHETLLGSHFCHFGTINTVAFHPSGKMFASGAVDGFVKLHMPQDSYMQSPGMDLVWTEPTEEEVAAADEEEEEDFIDDDLAFDDEVEGEEDEGEEQD
jgi:translation initiation factor 3 subunit I